MNTSPYPGNSGAISTQETESDQRRLKNQTLVLALGALGVVYGDIGTSPLYAIRECFHGHHAIALTPGNIFGVMSLVFWSLRWIKKDESTLRKGRSSGGQLNHC